MGVSTGAYTKLFSCELSKQQRSLLTTEQLEHGPYKDWFWCWINERGHLTDDIRQRSERPWLMDWNTTSKQRQEDGSKFKNSLVYTVNFRPPA